MASKVKFPKSPTLTYNACVAGIRDGLNQLDILKQLGISKPTLKEHLIQKDTSWRLLSKEVKSNIESKSTKSKGSKGKSNTKKTTSKSTSSHKPPSGGDSDDEDPDQEEDPLKKIPPVNDQFRELIGYVQFAEQHVDRVTTGDILKFYEKTKMLENEEKDFAEDNAFLGEVEVLLLQHEIMRLQLPALDIKVENPDLIEEGI